MLFSKKNIICSYASLYACIKVKGPPAVCWLLQKNGSFPFVPSPLPPVRYALLSPIPADTEHDSLHRKLLCKNMARASEACKQNAPSKLGAQTKKVQIFIWIFISLDA